MKIASFAPALLLAAGTTLAMAQTSQANDQKPAPPAETRSFDISAIDKTADPCTDFYQYA